LQSLALLLQGGMSLVPALEIARRSITNLYLKEYVRTMISNVQSGAMLTDAMQDTRNTFFKADLILLMTIGQEGSCLDVMVQRAADMYQQHINRMLNAYVLIVQPLLIFILGCLVAALIFAVYTPLFNLADAL
jgi:type IV pilus assembly protein PilC